MLEAFVGAVILVFYMILGFKRPVLALWTMPLLALALVFEAIASERPDLFLFAALLVLLTLIVIAMSEREPDAQQWYHKWAFWALMMITVMIGLIALLVGFGMLGAGMVLPLLFILGGLGVGASLISYGITSRHAKVVHVFSTLGTSMRQNLPLPMALDCATMGREDSIASTLRRIEKWVVQGYPVVEAIRRGYPQCPAQALALLTATERVGQVPAAIEAIRADAELRASERGRLRPVHPIYPFVILTIMFLIIMGLMTFVIPQFKSVLEEMVGGELPTATQVVLAISGFIAYDYGGAILLLSLFVAFVVVPALWLRGRFCQRRPEKPYLLSRLGDWVKWHFPVLHWFERNRSTLQVVEMLRLAAQAGSPVDEAIRSTLQLDINLCFRKRLARWLQRVERGENIAAAARQCQLGAPLAWAFDANAGTDDVTTILEMLEAFYRSNYGYRANLVRFIFWPCVILALGATVGFVVFAVFLPGVEVIGTMADLVYP